MNLNIKLNSRGGGQTLVKIIAFTTAHRNNLL